MGICVGRAIEDRFLHPVLTRQSDFNTERRAGSRQLECVCNCKDSQILLPVIYNKKSDTKMYDK